MTRSPTDNGAITTHDVDLAAITVLPDRLRQVRADTVTSLADSMKERGLQQPIILRSAATGFHLVAGRHRLEAARSLNWQIITARILPADTDENDARLAEIDENLQRAELTTAEHAIFTAERKRIHAEKLERTSLQLLRRDKWTKTGPQRAMIESRPSEYLKPWWISSLNSS